MSGTPQRRDGAGRILQLTTTLSARRGDHRSVVAIADMVIAAYWNTMPPSRDSTTRKVALCHSERRRRRQTWRFWGLCARMCLGAERCSVL
eukprot:scaffold803_cov310-Pinguiococcus_pyrenoidosus.AAC.111